MSLGRENTARAVAGISQFKVNREGTAAYFRLLLLAWDRGTRKLAVVISPSSYRERALS